ncbi:uncharacterized protein LOC112600030 [Melanaphis sacchari]|uniref:uncharacterized protein LOC112600030 n=1 Tax=Melanaphis sacchari TaxID=742174 RepID=UPI000DC14CDF|nr:uncharacterized protein LOC112600030 [Melanaphis sacchari]
MFSSLFWVVLTTLVMFSLAAKIVENKKKDFNYVINFDNDTTDNDNSLRAMPFRPESKANATRFDQTIKVKIHQKRHQEDVNITTYIDEVVSKLFKRITDFIGSFLSTNCETMSEFRADDEVCLCKNTSVLYYLTRNVCFLIKVNVTSIEGKNHRT